MEGEKQAMVEGLRGPALERGHGVKTINRKRLCHVTLVKVVIGMSMMGEKDSCGHATNAKAG